MKCPAVPSRPRRRGAIVVFELDPFVRDVAVLLGLLGPTGLLGYVWRSAVFKTRLEDRLNRLEEHDRELKRRLRALESAIAESRRESSG